MTYAPGVRLLKNVMIPMRDGVRLACDLYVPDSDDSEPLPIVMEYIPYRKDEVGPAGRFYSYLPQNGYIVARVDIRGTGASEGVNVDEYAKQEQLDGYDAIEWLAEQPFCTGDVNMMGISYGGFTSLQVATHRPPHLKTIIPMYFTDDRYTDDCHFRGGLLRQYYNLTHYGIFMIAYNAMPPYPEWSADWADVWREHLEGNDPALLTWLRDQTNSPYWRHGSVADVVDRITCPVFLIGGWRDGYPNPPLRLFEALGSPKKLLLGPWNHKPPDVATPGPRVDHLHEVVRWLDHWCKDRETGIMEEPAAAIFLQRYEAPDADRVISAGAWRAEDVYPIPGAGERTLFLSATGTLADAAGAELSDIYRYDATVGTTAGLWSGGLEFGQSGDQRPDEALSLVYTSAPIGEELEILGRPTVVLHVASTASVIGFAAALSEVGPDGSSHLIAKGMLNGTRRDSLTDPEPLVPGEVYELEIEIDATGWTFTPGNRIRLSLSSADWPNVWPTPEPATNTVWHGGTRASRLVLPTIPAAQRPAPAFEPSPVPMLRQSMRLTPPVWEVTRDALTRRARVHLVEDLRDRINATTTIERHYELWTEVDADDPAGAHARGLHRSTIHRLNTSTTATSAVAIQATASHLHVTIDLEVSIDGALHHHDAWVESIPRRLL